jgi:hypothetical protein
MPIDKTGSNAMFESTGKTRETDPKPPFDFWEWARHHPATTAFGVAVFAALCLLSAPPKQPLTDRAPDETPLFI